MTYVITQSCCSDATCILECPVDCIRPTPGDPEFLHAEMLYIDPGSCIECGACQEACPVDAARPVDDLPAHLRHFVEFNAGYFVRNPLRPSTYGIDRPSRPVTERGVLRVAIVGSGPSAAYLAEDLLGRGNVHIDIVEKLPTPWGLLRFGVAPDHLPTKNLASAFDRPFRSDAFEYHLNVEVGRDVTVEELSESHHAVVVATGAAHPAPWDVAGSTLPGVHSATDFVAWYNGHPDHVDSTFDLSCERVVIIGNGNVALDVARILLMGPDELLASDVAEHARQALARSRVREVVVVGRRGPVQASYTAAELSAMAKLPGVDIFIDPADAAIDPASQRYLTGPQATYGDELKANLVAQIAAAEPHHAGRRMVFRYLAEATRVVGDVRVEGVEFRRNEMVSDGGSVVVRASDNETPLVEPAGLVLTAIGYRGRPIPGVPFDMNRSAIPHQQGRVLDDTGATTPGLYTVGWAKRGAQGGIGAGRFDAQETADRIVDDFNKGLLNSTGTPLADILASRSLDVVTAAGWQAINTHELTAGATAGRPRQKLVRIEDMLQIAATTR